MLKVFKGFNLLFFAPLAPLSKKESGILQSSDIAGY